MMQYVPRYNKSKSGKAINILAGIVVAILFASWGLRLFKVYIWGWISITCLVLISLYGLFIGCSGAIIGILKWRNFKKEVEADPELDDYLLVEVQQFLKTNLWTAGFTLLVLVLLWMTCYPQTP